MKTQAYIVKNSEPVALVYTDLPNGSEVTYAYDSTSEQINAAREQNLVNAQIGKISRAKKYAKYKPTLEIADFINDSRDEVLIK